MPPTSRRRQNSSPLQGDPHAGGSFEGRQPADVQLSDNDPKALAVQLCLLNSTIDSNRADAMAQYWGGHKFGSNFCHRKTESNCCQKRQSNTDCRVLVETNATAASHCYQDRDARP